MILALSAIFVGAVTQRIAGMGFAMMVAPFVVLAFGPSQGVVLVNLCGTAVALVTMLSLSHDIQWSTFGWLTISSLIGVIAGATVVNSLDVPLFQVLVGSILLLAVVGSVLIARTSLHVSGLRWTIAAGASTGALVTAAGIGGPPMTIYAVLSRWDQRLFAATMQPVPGSGFARGGRGQPRRSRPGVLAGAGTRVFVCSILLVWRHLIKEPPGRRRVCATDNESCTVGVAGGGRRGSHWGQVLRLITRSMRGVHDCLPRWWTPGGRKAGFA